jgi:hypothetical protein
MFMREVVHKEWVTLRNIQVMENIVEADDYADVFGRKLLIETSLCHRMTPELGGCSRYS